LSGASRRSRSSVTASSVVIGTPRLRPLARADARARLLMSIPVAERRGLTIASESATSPLAVRWQACRLLGSHPEDQAIRPELTRRADLQRRARRAGLAVEASQRACRPTDPGQGRSRGRAGLGPCMSPRPQRRSGRAGLRRDPGPRRLSSPVASRPSPVRRAAMPYRAWW
jgi:hypothetical protein